MFVFRLRMFTRRWRRKRVLYYSILLILCVILLTGRQYFSAKDDTSGLPNVSENRHFTRSAHNRPNTGTSYAIEDTMNQRKKHLMNRCMSESIDVYKPLRLTHYIYNKKHNFLYCHVEKCGSTFWRRVIRQVNKNITESPYNIKPQYNWMDYDKGIGDEERKEIDNLSKQSKTFLFVRNPYHRIFSGYIDKIYSPNPSFWIFIGKYIVQKFREGAPKTHCGHDITFSEYVKFAVHSESTKVHQDMHTQSVWKMCDPCRAKFDIIGKMESFKEDTFYIFDKLNMEPYKYVLRNISKDSVNDAMYDIAQAYVNMRKGASNCMSKEKVAERIWRKLQIKGLISTRIQVPVILADLQDDTSVFELFKDANSISPRAELKQQKHSLFLEAYRSVPLNVLYRYAEVFKRDFDLFGYDPYPPEIFSRSNMTSKKSGLFDF